MERASYPYYGEEPLWQPGSGRHRRDAHVPGLRQRGHDRGNHAHYGGAPTLNELRRQLCDSHVAGNWFVAVDPRASTRDRAGQGPSDTSMRGNLEKTSTRHGGPWRNPSRHPGGGGGSLT